MKYTKLRHEQSQTIPDAYYLYFHNTVPYRLNVTTGATWVLDTNKGTWKRVDEPRETPAE